MTQIRLFTKNMYQIFGYVQRLYCVLHSAIGIDPINIVPVDSFGDLFSLRPYSKTNFYQINHSSFVVHENIILIKK